MKANLVVGVAAAIGVLWLGFAVIFRPAVTELTEGSPPNGEQGKPLIVSKGAVEAISKPRAQADAKSLDNKAMQLREDFGESVDAATCIRLQGRLGEFMRDTMPGSFRSKLGKKWVTECAAALPINGGVRLRFLSTLADAAPDNADVLMVLASTEFGLADTDAALAHFKRAVALDPTPENTYGLGTAALALAQLKKFGGAPEQAVALAKEAQAELKAANRGGEYEGNARYWIARAEADVGAGNADDAIASTDSALFALREMNSREAPWLYFKIGEVRFKAGERQTGIAYMDQGISMALPDFKDSLVLQKKLVVSGRF